MAEEFSVTANSNSTLGWATYNSKSWTVGQAMQGGYDADENHTDSTRRVGIMVFNGAGAALKNKRITKIVLKLKSDNAGFSDRNKTMYLWTSTTQALDTSLKGSAVVGEALGSYSGDFHSATDTITMDAETNPDLFDAMKNYFRAGNSALVIFDEANATYYQAYSRHYMRITSATLTVTYEEGGIVYFDTGSELVPCHAFYDTGSELVQCNVYRDTGTELEPIGG